MVVVAQSGLKALPQKTSMPRNFLWEGLAPPTLFDAIAIYPQAHDQPEGSATKMAMPRNFLWEGLQPRRCSTRLRCTRNRVAESKGLSCKKALMSRNLLWEGLQ